MQLIKGFKYQAIIVLSNEYPIRQLDDLQLVINGPSGGSKAFSIGKGIEKTSNPYVFLLLVPGSYTKTLNTVDENTYQLGIADANLGLIRSTHQKIMLSAAGGGSQVLYSGLFNVSLDFGIFSMNYTDLPMLHTAGENDVVSVPVSGVKDGDTITHDYDAELVVVGFWNADSSQLEIPTQFKATNADQYGFQLSTGLDASFSEYQFNGKLICLKV